MGSISQRSCHAYLPSVKYTTAQKSKITTEKKRKRGTEEGREGTRKRNGERGEREEREEKQFQKNYERKIDEKMQQT